MYTTKEKFFCVSLFIVWVAILIAVGVPIMIHESSIVFDFWKGFQF